MIVRNDLKCRKPSSDKFEKRWFAESRQRYTTKEKREEKLLYRRDSTSRTVLAEKICLQGGGSGVDLLMKVWVLNGKDFILLKLPRGEVEPTDQCPSTPKTLQQ